MPLIPPVLHLSLSHLLIDLISLALKRHRQRSFSLVRQLPLTLGLFFQPRHGILK